MKAMRTVKEIMKPVVTIGPKPAILEALRAPVSDRTAYVLPAAYGYGFRGLQDTIWGLWPNDSLTIDLGMSVSTLLQMDGNNLDIVYPSLALESAGYHSIIYWNDPALIPTPSPDLQQASSLPFYATPVYFYVTAAGILVAAAVAMTALKFRGAHRC